MASDILLLASVFLVIGAVVLWRLPSGYCPQCWHCKQQRLEEAALKREKETIEVNRRKRESHLWFHKTYGKDGCPYCEEHHLEE